MKAPDKSLRYASQNSGAFLFAKAEMAKGSFLLKL